MTNALRTLSIGLVTVVVAAAAYADCTCKTSAKKDGWCTDCKVGFVDGVKIKSRKLYDALQGELVSADKTSCSGCKAAAAKAATSKLTSAKLASDKGATCCGKTFVGKKSYRSPVAAILASGHPVDMAKIADSKCEGCKAAAKNNGFCKDCGVGIVAGRLYKGKENFAKAQQAYATLVKASKAVDVCEGCAVAMVTDSKCESCKVSFKDGKMIK